MAELFPYGRNASGLPDGLRCYETASEAMSVIADCPAETAVIYDAALHSSALQIPESAAAKDDLSHAGLLLGGAGALGLSRFACLNWFLLNPNPNYRCASWRATPSLCMIRPETLRDLGGFDSAYESPAARLMDYGFRLLSAGGRVSHDPAWLGSGPSMHKSDPIGLVDEFVFLLRHIGRLHAAWSAFWSPLAGVNPIAVWSAFGRARRRVRQNLRPIPSSGVVSSRLIGAEKRQEVRGITAIIPTLNRYDYIARSIVSLLKQNPRPDEVIVVDQTPKERRQPEIYAPFEGPGFRVIYQDRPGQSTSRNAAIKEATGEWCLLWEDDTEAWDDLMQEHVRAVEYSGADASTGVSLAPWKTAEYIPEKKRHHQLADVLATGNCLVRRDALLEVGGLDVAFNRGSGADHDLGTRLYLSGKEIVFNPKAIETHHKAPSGGMRTYGAWWRNSTTWLSPYPPPTQVYTVRRYYPRQYWLPLYLLHFWTAAHRQQKFTELMWLWMSAPWKLWRSTRAASRLKTELGLLADSRVGA